MELHILVTDSDITIWWDKEGVNVSEYEVSIDGNTSKTAKTHYTWEDLEPDTEYHVEVKALLADSNIVDTANEENKAKTSIAKVRTLKTKRRIDVTKAPYNAIGDDVPFIVESVTVNV